MTIKDFGAIDSKRTSQQSETSNEKDFLKMLANQKNRDFQKQDDSSPTAEHLDEPSIIGKKELEGTTHDSQSKDLPPFAENIRISDMLKHQSNDIEEIIKE